MLGPGWGSQEQRGIGTGTSGAGTHNTQARAESTQWFLAFKRNSSGKEGVRGVIAIFHKLKRGIGKQSLTALRDAQQTDKRNQP